MKHKNLRLERFRKLITSREQMKQNPANIERELRELLKQELNLEELNELKELFDFAVKEDSGERNKEFGIIYANYGDGILYAKIKQFYGPTQLVPCRIPDQLAGRIFEKLGGRSLSEGDAVWVEFDPQKPSFLQYFMIVSTANFW